MCLDCVVSVQTKCQRTEMKEKPPALKQPDFKLFPEK